MKIGTIHVIICGTILTAVFFAASCREEPRRYTRPLMGTIVNVTVAASDSDTALRAAEAAFSEIARLEEIMSPYRKGSDVWRVNRDAAALPVEVSADTFRVLMASAAMASESGGAFDVTFMPLGRIWNYESEPFTPPGPAAVARAKVLVNYKNLVLNPQNRSVRFLRPGMGIGLGAIAKGYAIGRAMAAIRALGIDDCIVEIGGDLQVSGTKQGRPWITGLRHPRHGGLLLSIAMEPGESVVTSGDYERFAIHRGKRYGHIIDPRTGYPTESFESVTVVSGDPMFADGAATAIFVLGPDEYRRFVDRHGDIGVILIDLKGNVMISKSLREKIVLFEKIPVRWI